MDVELCVDVYVDVDVAEWYIPWAVALTPVLSMISISSIFTDRADALDAPQEQECIPDYTQDGPPWLAEILLE